MLVFRAVKINFPGLAIFLLIVVLGQQYAMAADGSVVPPHDATTMSAATISPSPDLSGSEDVSMLLRRIDQLEQQVKYLRNEVRILGKQVGANRTLANMVKEGKSLASDAWDIAVEARAIAVRAEQKADQARRAPGE